MYKDRFTGLYHTHFREYDPIHGRWLSEDPAGYNDGLNLYASYAGVNWKDPYGLNSFGWNREEWTTIDRVRNAYFNRFYGSKNKWKEADYPNAINLLKWAESEDWTFEEADYYLSNHSIDYTNKIIYISHGWLGTVTEATATGYLYNALSEAYHQEKILPKKVINYTTEQPGSTWYNSGYGWAFYDEMSFKIGFGNWAAAYEGGDAYGNDWTSKQKFDNVIIGGLQSSLFVAPFVSFGKQTLTNIVLRGVRVPVGLNKPMQMLMSGLDRVTGQEWVLFVNEQGHHILRMGAYKGEVSFQGAVNVLGHTHSDYKYTDLMLSKDDAFALIKLQNETSLIPGKGLNPFAKKMDVIDAFKKYKGMK